MDRQRRATAIDLGLCAVILAYGLSATTDASFNNPRATVVGSLLLPTLILPIVLRRRAPLAAACAFAAASVVSGIPTFDQLRFIVAIPVAVIVAFTLATNEDWSRAVAGMVVVHAGLAFDGATDVFNGIGGVARIVAFSSPLCIAVFAAGRVVRSREHLAGQLIERSEQLLRRREALAALAVEIDLDRLASDLDHAARSRLQEMIALASAHETDPVLGRKQFSRIEALGRESLDQMRTLLGLLRNVHGARAPRPTLEQLDALLAEARAGGRVVDLDIVGERRPLAAGIELAAYRILQYALVAVDGAQDEPAKVRVRYLPDELELEVSGLRLEGAATGAALAAARERVSALGGSFSAEAPSPGQQVLCARLPVVVTGA